MGVEEYRNASSVAMGWLMIALVAALTVFLGVSETWPIWGWLVGAGVASGLVWVTYRTLFRPVLRVMSDSVVVVNPFRTHVVAWSDVARFMINPVGGFMFVLRQDGTTVTVGAVGASDPFWKRQRDSWADRIATELNRRAVESRGEDWEAVADRYRTSAPKSLSSRIVRGVVLIGVVAYFVYLILTN